MKSLLIALFVAALLSFSLVGAEVSQQEAGTTCNPYSIDGETIQVTGPLTCEGEYWICEFTYYGNKQNLLIPVSVSSSNPIGATSDLLKDIISVKYAVDNGDSYIFGTLLSDQTFAVQLAGMNATLENYLNSLRTLKNAGQVSEKNFNEFADRVSGLKGSSLELSVEVLKLKNLSAGFTENPNCIDLIDFLDRLNTTSTLAMNFTSEWITFITRYNSLAASISGTYLTRINPSDAQIVQQGIVSISPTLESYSEGESEFFNKSRANLASRTDRKGAKERLDAAYAIVKASGSQTAIAKYNEASTAFGSGKYADTIRLSSEAIALTSETPIDNGGGEPSLEKPADYSIFIIAIAFLAVLAIVLALKQRGGGDYNDPPERLTKKDNKSKTGGWGWSKSGGV